MLAILLASSLAKAGAVTACGIGTGVSSGGLVGATCLIRSTYTYAPVGASAGVGFVGASAAAHLYLGYWDFSAGGGYGPMVYLEDNGAIVLRLRPHGTMSVGFHDTDKDKWSFGLGLSSVPTERGPWTWTVGGNLTLYVWEGNRPKLDDKPTTGSTPRGGPQLTTVPVTGKGASAAEARRNAIERAVAAVVSDLVPADRFEEAADVVLAEPEGYVVQLRISSESRDPETGAYVCVAKPEIDATAIKRALQARGVEVE